MHQSEHGHTSIGTHGKALLVDFAEPIIRARGALSYLIKRLDCAGSARRRVNQ